MEEIAVCCPACGWSTRLAADLAGKRVRCRACQVPFRAEAVPQPPEGPLPQAIPLPPEAPADPELITEPSPPDLAATVKTVQDFFTTVFRCYASGALWERVTEYSPGRDSTAEGRLAVRLTARKKHPGVQYRDGAWDVQLPACCVVCGRDAQEEVQEVRTVTDMTWPLWVPIAFLVGDLFLVVLLGLVTRGLKPMILVPGGLLVPLLALGCVIGYGLRREVAVTLRMRRCDRHRSATGAPRLVAHGETLVVRFEDEEVRDLFRAKRRKEPKKRKREPERHVTAEEPVELAAPAPHWEPPPLPAAPKPETVFSADHALPPLPPLPIGEEDLVPEVPILAEDEPLEATLVDDLPPLLPLPPPAGMWDQLTMPVSGGDLVPEAPAAADRLDPLPVDEPLAEEPQGEYFEVGRPAGNGLCSDDRCPCPNTVIPPGEGYLYVSQEVIDYRCDCRTTEEFLAKQRQEGDDAFGAGAVVPILMCRAGAARRGLDLEVAAADAAHWWRTGLVPLRPTPRGSLAE